MITTKTITSEKVKTIAGPAGQLQIEMTDAPGAKRDAWGIVCHPHPLHGGTMDNKVVVTLAKAFQALGVSTVRFNFRGVGKSEGRFDQGQGELEDLMAVIDWVQRERAPAEIWLAGFSFGACMAARACAQLPLMNRLVTVAPPVDRFAMANLAPITCPWILVQGEQDEIVSANDVFAWAEKRHPKPTILRFKDAGHFFHGQLIELRMELEKALV